jgi:hypothetical protein
MNQPDERSTADGMLPQAACRNYRGVYCFPPAGSSRLLVLSGYFSAAPGPSRYFFFFSLCIV